MDVGRELGLGLAGVLAHPLGSLGAVVGNGANTDGEHVDLTAGGGGLEELREPRTHPVAVGIVGHADAGVDDASRSRPCPGGVVLDDGWPNASSRHRRAVVDLDASQDARQVGLGGIVDVTRGPLRLPPGPAGRVPHDVPHEDTDPLSSRPTAHGNADQGDGDEPQRHQGEQRSPLSDRHGQPTRERGSEDEEHLWAGEAEEPALPVAGGGGSVDGHARNAPSSATAAASSASATWAGSLATPRLGRTRGRSGCAAGSACRHDVAGWCRSSPDGRPLPGP